MTNRINQQELDDRLISTDHLRLEDEERLKESFIVIYANTNTTLMYDGRGLSAEERVELVEFLIKQVQFNTHLERKIIAQSGNIYFVY